MAAMYGGNPFGSGFVLLPDGSPALPGVTAIRSAPFPGSYLTLNDGIQGGAWVSLGGIILQATAVEFRGSPITLNGPTKNIGMPGPYASDAAAGTAGVLTGTLYSQSDGAGGLRVMVKA